MRRLRSRTPAAWASVVLSDFDAFLIDHAACERKASALALSLVARYRDRAGLVTAMIELAREELLHFQQAWLLLTARGLALGPDTKDEYVNRMTRCIRHGGDATLMDRLLVAGVVEARGCERFGLLADHLEDHALRDFYRELARAEARHQTLFVEQARAIADPAAVDARLDALLDAEARVIAELPFRPALH